MTVCHDGISGYETALKNSYDAIISDVMLPGMDGFSIVKKLRGMKVWTPIIMLTARVELQDKLQGFDAENGEVNFTLKDAASYRTKGASKATPGFDVMDYGQETYEFSSSTQDARHFDKYVLKVLQEDAEILSELFNSEEK